MTGQRSVIVSVLKGESPQSVSVDGLFGQLHTAVREVRAHHPDLQDYHLYDIHLRLEQGELQAVLDFRKT
ncbi:MAG: hypothetical protein K6T26_03430 [Alicyclobacillus sp.]|nr:hypothetical protein [Alicyclobacillus sp.]